MDARVKRTYRSLYRAFCELLREKPYAQLSINDLCVRAGVSRPTFYKHFPGKTVFLRFCVELMMRTQDRQFRMRHPGLTGQNYAELAAEAVFDDMLAHESLIDELLDSEKTRCEVIHAVHSTLVALYLERCPGSRIERTGPSPRWICPEDCAYRSAIVTVSDNGTSAWGGVDVAPEDLRDERCTYAVFVTSGIINSVLHWWATGHTRSGRAELMRILAQHGPGCASEKRELNAGRALARR